MARSSAIAASTTNGIHLICNHNLDALTGLEALMEGQVYCTITSPPYKDEDGFSMDLMERLATQLFRVHARDTLLFFNFGHMAGSKLRPFGCAELLALHGFRLVDTVIWIKGHFTPVQGQRSLNNLYEFVFIFAKGNPQLDRMAISIPYADPSNAHRYGKPARCPGNVWYLPHDTIQSRDQRLHPHAFPVALPTQCLKLAGLKPDSLVLDPFSGSGTTAVATLLMRNRLQFMGFERDPERYQMANLRIAALLEWLGSKTQEGAKR
ncbi:MAG: site-specific DNA-methyltransferase [Spirochaetales bacterium]|nr:site-specific DNA-methyltransferase [Spirochaetales bacterium]